MKSETTTNMKIESYTSKYLAKQNKFSSESKSGRFFCHEYSGWVVVCFIYCVYLHIRLFYCFEPRRLNRQIYDTRCAKRAPNQIGQVNRSKLIQWILMSSCSQHSFRIVSIEIGGKLAVFSSQDCTLTCCSTYAWFHSLDLAWNPSAHILLQWEKKNDSFYRRCRICFRNSCRHRSCIVF